MSATSPINNFLQFNSLGISPTEEVLISCNIAYLSTEWLTSVNPFLGATFITMVSLVSLAVTPTISSWLYEYRENTLQPTATKMLNITISCLSAKTICYAFGLNITFNQMIKVSTAFIVSVIVVQCTIKALNDKWSK